MQLACRGSRPADAVLNHQPSHFNCRPMRAIAAPNSVVEPVHNKAMPVMLMTPADVDRWQGAETVEEGRDRRGSP